MRDYSKVSAQFWTGKTGKALRGDMQAQLIALYLMTSPHSNMIGVFNCPILYMAHETGSTIEGASKGLLSLCEGGFCTYDHDSETVWVHEMAKFQIEDQLKPGDKRVAGIQKQYSTMPEGRIKSGFFEKYSVAFYLSKPDKKRKPLASPLQAPPKPEAGTEAEAEAETEEIQETLLSGKPDDVPVNGKKKLSEACAEVLGFLNEKTGRNYRPVAANINLIAARLKQGATVIECRQVIAKKCREWRDDPNQEIYLRPKTLFNATNFANYQGELGV